MKKTCRERRRTIFLTFSLAILTILSLAACQNSSDEKMEEVVFCTEDAKLCPDGSSVSRVPPSCDFAACPQISNPQTSMTENKIDLADVPTADVSADIPQARAPIVGDTVAKIETNHGDIWLRLTPDATPKTVENFVGLAERGYYDGIIFHRVIPDFMIQGGDPDGNGTGGTSIWGEEFEDEFTPELANIRGSISMANRGPKTNGSQFFINQADNVFLDGKHSVFGQTIDGLAVVDEIAGVERGAADKPTTDVVMKTVKIYEVE